jgi:hypothetical protein
MTAKGLLAAEIAKKESKPSSEKTAIKAAGKKDDKSKIKNGPSRDKQIPVFEGPGVIKHIIACLGKGNMTQSEILDSLCKQFPDRARVKMSHTLHCQIGGKKRPLRIEREKNIKVVINDNGIYSIKK